MLSSLTEYLGVTEPSLYKEESIDEGWLVIETREETTTDLPLEETSNFVNQELDTDNPCSSSTSSGASDMSLDASTLQEDSEMVYSNSEPEFDVCWARVQSHKFNRHGKRRRSSLKRLDPQASKRSAADLVLLSEMHAYQLRPRSNMAGKTRRLSNKNKNLRNKEFFQPRPAGKNH